ncbi:hypothetical protein Tco_0237000 [Tanacetum coccineum]
MPIQFLMFYETEMPEMCLPLCKRPCRTTPGPGYKVGESSAAGTTRQVGPTTARADLYGFANVRAAPGMPDTHSRSNGGGGQIITCRLGTVEGCLRSDAFRGHYSFGTTVSGGTKDEEEPQDSDDRASDTAGDLAKDPEEPELPEEAKNGTKRKAHKNHEVKASHRNVPTSHHNSHSQRDPTTTLRSQCQLQAHDRRGVSLLCWQERATTHNAMIWHTSGTRVQKEWSACPSGLRGWNTVISASNYTVENQVKFATWRINTLAERQTENKRKFEDAPRNNQTQQPNKRQNTGRVYAAGNGDRKPYEEAKPRCHFRNNCPQWKNKNQGNGNAVARAYAVGVAGQNPDNNVVTVPRLLLKDVQLFGILPSRRLGQVEEKQLQEVRCHNLPEVFPRIARFIHYRQVEFHIGSSTGAAPVSTGHLSIAPQK